ncbi:MAG: efflux RND transporter periplasmic adaptor subunit, partial [Flavobacteriales bacterium]|nr:efflux RND transporter periplasmic adaptor subunit [Flavobacteriales bacterium]
MKNVFPIAILAIFFASCGTPSVEADTQKIESWLATSSTNLDSAGMAIQAWTLAEFDAREAELATLKETVDVADKNSDNYSKLKAEYESALKDFEADKTKFLQDRKAQISAVYDQANELITSIDGQIGDLNKTRKDPMITIHEVDEMLFKDYFTVKGNVEAKNNAVIFPEMSGKIIRVYATKGSRVSKGQAIVELDTDVIRKQIAEVESSLTLAEDLYTRQKALWDQNIGSEVQYLEAKNRKESLENTRATLKSQLNMGTVRAPFAGVLDELNVKNGEMAMPGMPIGRVVNLDEVYIEADISENHFG